MRFFKLREKTTSIRHAPLFLLFSAKMCIEILFPSFPVLSISNRWKTDLFQVSNLYPRARFFMGWKDELIFLTSLLFFTISYLQTFLKVEVMRWLKEVCKLPTIFEPKVTCEWVSGIRLMLSRTFRKGVPIDFNVPFGDRQIELVCQINKFGRIPHFYATVDVSSYCAPKYKWNSRCS